MRRALALVCVVLFACSDSDDPSSPSGPSVVDTTPPSAVTDLQVAAYDVGRATVTWTAPGDDGTTGTASEYRIAFDAAPITEGTWPDCTALFAPPAPATAGTAQSAQIVEPPFPDLYVALASVDDAGNWSPLSNVAHGHVRGAYEVVQLTSSGPNRHPCVNEGFVTWVGWTPEGEEIFIAGLGGAFPTPGVLTDNGGEKMHPSSHGAEKIVWQGRDDPADDWEIFVYSRLAVPRYRAHTDDDVHDRRPVVAGGGNFAWQHGSTTREEVLYWNESLHEQVRISHACCPTDEYSNTNPVADDFTVVFESWHRTGSGDRAATYLWDGALHDISATVDARFSRNYSLDAGTLAYEWGTGTPMIRYWDGATVRDVAPGYAPSLDDGWIAYQVHVGGDWEIHLWDGTNVVQITDNDFDDTDPSLHGDRLAWKGRKEGMDHIFFARLPPRERIGRSIPTALPIRP
jgi:hypothetical protein